MTQTEALRLALEALENSDDLVRENAYSAEQLYGNYPARQGKVRGLKALVEDHEKAITAIKAALEAKDEPVAWTLLLVGEHHGIIGKAGDAFASAPAHYRRVDVYTNPPQRKPLTGLEAETLFDNCGGKWNGDHWVIKDADLHDFARAIEANLNIKGE